MRIVVEIKPASLTRMELVEAINELQYELSARGAAIPPTEQEIELVRSQRKIDAIRSYRNRTGCMLREAKDVMDRV